MTELSIFLGLVALALAVLYVRELRWRQDLQGKFEALSDDLARSVEQHRSAASSVERLRRDAPRLEASARRDTIAELIVLDDHVQRALAHREGSSLEDLQLGLGLLAKDLDQTWARCGLTRVHPQPDDAFDPELHDAVSSRAAPEVEAACIDAVLRDGFLDGEQLLRPAMVSVCVPAAPVPEEKPTDEPEVASGERSEEGEGAAEEIVGEVEGEVAEEEVEVAKEKSAE